MSYGGYQRWGGGPPDHSQMAAVLLRLLLPVGLALVFGSVSLARGCQRGPFGRSQSVAMTPAQETALGLQAAAEIRSKEPTLPHGEKAFQGVETVARRLIAACENQQVLARMQLPRPDFQWEIEVIRANTVNAFCLPGGKVFVYTGILPVCENQAGLACVLGHEIGHALTHHGAERAAQEKFVHGLGTGVSFSVGGMDYSTQRAAMALFSAGAKFGGLLPFSRKHESEADRIGLTLMAAAGFDPREAPRFWQRMAAQGGGAPAQWMSTHPSHETRIRDLQAWLPEAVEVFDAYGPAASARQTLPGRAEAAAAALQEFDNLLEKGRARPAPPPAGKRNGARPAPDGRDDGAAPLG